MKVWRAPYTFHITLFFVVAIALLGLAGVGIALLVPFVRVPQDEWPLSLRLFGLVCGILLSIGVAAVALQRATRHASLRYRLDRNAITVSQRGWRYTIPLDQIVAVQAADEQPQLPAAKPLLRFGHGATGQALIVETQQNMYRLALQQRSQFAHELQERRQLGVVQRQPEGLQSIEGRWSSLTSSGTARQLSLLTLALNLTLWGLLAWQYQGLPETIPVRFDPVGGTAGARPRSYTLLLPAAGTAAAWLNLGLAVLFSRRARLASELLLVGAVLVQLVLLAAVWFVITSAT